VPRRVLGSIHMSIVREIPATPNASENYHERSWPRSHPTEVERLKANRASVTARRQWRVIVGVVPRLPTASASSSKAMGFVQDS
jgi:hypothetical protein